MTRESRSDESLVEEYYSTGQQATLGVLYARYLELMYGVCLRYLHDAGRAEDASMDIYEQLVVKLRQHRVDAFRPWLYRLARNHCLMLLRRTASSYSLNSQSVADSNLIALDDVQIADLLHPSDDVNTQELQLDALDGCREALPADQATCIKRFYINGDSYADIAEAQAWSLSKVRSAIQNGRRNLRRCLKQTLQIAS